MHWTKKRKATGLKKSRLDMEGSTGTVIYILLGVFLAFGLNIVLGQALSTDMPVVAVESNSMVPTFYQGDILIIQGTANPDNYRNMLAIGDIIVFSVEGRDVPIVHRIKAINPDGSFQTQGDANTAQHPFEKRIEPGQIHGKVLMTVPYLGWVKIGITEYLLPFLLKNVILIVVMGVTVMFLYLIVKEYR